MSVKSANHDHMTYRGMPRQRRRTKWTVNALYPLYTVVNVESAQAGALGDGGCHLDTAIPRAVGSLSPLHCLCTQTARCVHNQNSGRNWAWCREWGMKGNMLGLIRAVPRRAMEERSQGSTKGIDIPPVEAPCWTKSLHTLCSHRAKPEQSQASSARAHLPLFVCITHACKWTIREHKYHWTGLHTGDTLWSSNSYSWKYSNAALCAGSCDLHYM